MIKADRHKLELNGEAHVILSEFIMIGMKLKSIISEMEDESSRQAFFNDFQNDLIRMYKYDTFEQLIQADLNNEDINIKELFGLED